MAVGFAAAACSCCSSSPPPSPGKVEASVIMTLPLACRGCICKERLERLADCPLFSVSSLDSDDGGAIDDDDEDDEDDDDDDDGKEEIGMSRPAVAGVLERGSVIEPAASGIGNLRGGTGWVSTRVS